MHRSAKKRVGNKGVPLGRGTSHSEACDEVGIITGVAIGHAPTCMGFHTVRL